MSKTFFALMAFFLGFLTLSASHLNGGYLEIWEVRGLTVTFRFNGIAIAGSEVFIGGGTFGFGDGTKFEGSFEVTSRPINSEYNLSSFEIIHTYSAPGSYTVSYQEDGRDEHLLNAGSNSDVFYFEINFKIDPAVSNHFPVMDASLLPWVTAQGKYQQGLKVQDLDGDLMTFQLVVPKTGPDSYLSDYQFPDIDLERFAGNLDGMIDLQDQFVGDGHSGAIALAIRVTEHRNIQGRWHKLSSSIVDFQLVISKTEAPDLELEINTNVCAAAPFLMKISGSSMLRINVPFYLLSDGSPVNSLDSTVYFQDTSFNLSLKSLDSPYGFGQVRLSALGNETATISSNIFYAADCELLTSYESLITGISVNLAPIRLYPNPSSGLVNIEKNELSELHFVLFDLAGNELIRGTTDKECLSLDLRALVSKGTYLLKFYEGGTLYQETKKLLIVD